MSLGDDLMKLSISSKQKKSDPVSDATKKGNVPTLGEVKRSLKVRVCQCIGDYIHLMFASDFDQESYSSYNPDGRASQ